MNLLSLLDDLNAKREKAPSSRKALFIDQATSKTVFVQDREESVRIGLHVDGLDDVDPTTANAELLVARWNSSEKLESALSEAIETIRDYKNIHPDDGLESMASEFLDKWGVK